MYYTGMWTDVLIMKGKGNSPIHQLEKHPFGGVDLSGLFEDAFGSDPGFTTGVGFD